jgi:hypothetical protein
MNRLGTKKSDAAHHEDLRPSFGKVVHPASEYTRCRSLKRATRNVAFMLCPRHVYFDRHPGRETGSNSTEGVESTPERPFVTAHTRCPNRQEYFSPVRRALGRCIGSDEENEYR